MPAPVYRVMKSTAPVIQKIESATAALNSALWSVTMVGSGIRSDFIEDDSDIDVLFVAKDKLNPTLAKDIGNTISKNNLHTSSVHLFGSIDCSRCSKIASAEMRVHFLVFEREQVVNWKKNNDYIMHMWSNNYRVLHGEDFLKDLEKPIINQSLLDDSEGTQAMLHNIYKTMILKDPERDQLEYKKTIKYHSKVLKSYQDNFPELSIDFGDPVFDINRDSLASLANEYMQVELRIKKYLSSEEDIKCR